MIKKILEKIKTSVNQRKEIPSEYPFVMYPEEKELLMKIIKKSKNYLEFGTGGSTIFTLINSNTHVTSVDTNEPWISFIKKYKIIKNNLSKKLDIHFIDIGPTKYWGYPVNETHKEKFPKFSSEIFNITNSEKYDTVLVDGRFRVACALQTILQCFNNKDLKILIHDYSLREGYKIVEKYLEITETAKTLFVFKIKNNINLKEVTQDYEKYKYISE